MFKSIRIRWHKYWADYWYDYMNSAYTLLDIQEGENRYYYHWYELRKLTGI